MWGKEREKREDETASTIVLSFLAIITNQTLETANQKYC